MQLSDIKFTGDPFKDCILARVYLRRMQPPPDKGCCLHCVHFSYRLPDRGNINDYHDCNLQETKVSVSPFQRSCEHYTPRDKPIGYPDEQ